MNNDRIQGNWKQLTGKLREEWGDITDNEYEEMAGNKDQLVGKLQAKYGWTREEADRLIDQRPAGLRLLRREPPHLVPVGALIDEASSAE